jgi:hypothetical protein
LFDFKCIWTYFDLNLEILFTFKIYVNDSYELLETQFSVYTNPAKDYINITTPDKAKGIIYSVSREKVKEFEDDPFTTLKTGFLKR